MKLICDFRLKKRDLFVFISIYLWVASRALLRTGTRASAGCVAKRFGSLSIGPGATGASSGTGTGGSAGCVAKRFRGLPLGRGATGGIDSIHNYDFFYF